MTVVATEPRTVTLPVCPTCGWIGKQPHGVHKGRQLCVGPKGAVHKQAKMVPKLFREVEAA